MEKKKLPHLEEAIDHLGAFAKGESNKRRQMWLNEILESMRRVYWDLGSDGDN